MYYILIRRFLATKIDFMAVECRGIYEWQWPTYLLSACSLQVSIEAEAMMNISLITQRKPNEANQQTNKPTNQQLWLERARVRIDDDWFTRGIARTNQILHVLLHNNTINVRKHATTATRTTTPIRTGGAQRKRTTSLGEGHGTFFGSLANLTSSHRIQKCSTN